MIVIFRWWFLTGMCAVGLGAYSSMELDLALRAAPDPVPFELAALEAGRMPKQPHVRIGEHVACFDRGYVFASSDHVRKVFYPVSLTRSEAIARAGEPPRPRTVVVQTEEFQHFEEVPEKPRTVPELSGILTTADHLLSEERFAVMRMAGGHSAREVPVLEAHRRPREEPLCWLGIGIAALLLLLSIWLLRVRGRSRRARDDATVALV